MQLSDKMLSFILLYHPFVGRGNRIPALRFEKQQFYIAGRLESGVACNACMYSQSCQWVWVNIFRVKS